MSREDSPDALERTMALYNDAWDRHDVEAIVALHAAEMVFDQHDGRHVSEREAVRSRIADVFAKWPDIAFTVRRQYIREDLVVQEWTASATHVNPLRRRDGSVLEPTGRLIGWEGVDVFPFENGLIRRKDSYADSLAILRQLEARG